MDREALKAHLRNRDCHHCVYCWQLRDGNQICSNPSQPKKSLPESLTCGHFDSQDGEEDKNMWTQHVIDVPDVPEDVSAHLRLRFQAVCPAGPKKFEEIYGPIDVDRILLEKIKEIKKRAAKHKI